MREVEGGRKECARVILVSEVPRGTCGCVDKRAKGTEAGAFSFGPADNCSVEYWGGSDVGIRGSKWPCVRQMTVTYYVAPLFICLLFFLQSVQTSNIRTQHPTRRGVMKHLSGMLPFSAPIPALGGRAGSQ